MNMQCSNRQLLCLLCITELADLYCNDLRQFGTLWYVEYELMDIMKYPDNVIYWHVTVVIVYEMDLTSNTVKQITENSG